MPKRKGASVKRGKKRGGRGLLVRVAPSKTTSHCFFSKLSYLTNCIKAKRLKPENTWKNQAPTFPLSSLWDLREETYENSPRRRVQSKLESNPGALSYLLLSQAASMSLRLMFKEHSSQSAGGFPTPQNLLSHKWNTSVLYIIKQRSSRQPSL